MESIQNPFCPGCSRHCELSRAECHRGEFFARTGTLPPPEFGEHSAGSHPHPSRVGREFQIGEVPRGESRHRRPVIQTPRYQEASLAEQVEMLLRALSMPRHGARDSQNRVLFLLSHEEPVTQRDLTDRLGIQPGSASELIGKLESSGFIIRTPSETDRRTQDVRLTERGRQRLAELGQARRSELQHRFDALSDQELQQLRSLLEKLCLQQSTP